MQYIKIRFCSELNCIDSEFERSIEDVFRSPSPIFKLSERVWLPQMDIYETMEEIVINAEIAGVKKEDLEVEITSKAVRIFGFRSANTGRERITYRLAEIQFGKFDRILYLPAKIDPGKVSSFYENGFLQIRLSKLPPGRTHKIAVEDR